MLEQIKKAIGAEDYHQILQLAEKDPVEFFSCFNVRGCRILGKNRLQWLKTVAKARLGNSQRQVYSYEVDSLILRAVEKGLGISTD